MRTEEGCGFRGVVVIRVVFRAMLGVCLEGEGGVVLVRGGLEVGVIAGFERGASATVVAATAACRIGWRGILRGTCGEDELGRRRILKEG